MAGIQITTAGESHGKALVGVIAGLPSNLALSAGYIDAELKRRQQGHGRGGRMKIESDGVEILTGVRWGKTLGTPLTLRIENRDWQNWQKGMSADAGDEGSIPPVTRPRPGHADLSGALKYDFKDIRNVLERSSARETAMRVAAGAVCKKFLSEFGVFVGSYVIRIGSVGVRIAAGGAAAGAWVGNPIDAGDRNPADAGGGASNALNSRNHNDARVGNDADAICRNPADACDCNPADAGGGASNALNSRNHNDAGAGNAADASYRNPAEAGDRNAADAGGASNALNSRNHNDAGVCNPADASYRNPADAGDRSAADAGGASNALNSRNPNDARVGNAADASYCNPADASYRNPADAGDRNHLKILHEKAEASPVRCPDEKDSAEMVRLIDEAAEKGDTLGGIFEVFATGLPPGLGSHTSWDAKLDARLAAALVGIQAVKGVEFGLGFEAGSRLGSQVMDEIRYGKPPGFHGNSNNAGSKCFYRTSNNAGGIEGGMSNAMPLIARAVMKPIPTQKKPLKSVDIATGETALAAYERSDVCAVPACSVIAEAMCAVVIANAFMEKFAGDSIGETLRNYHGYLRQVQEF